MKNTMINLNIINKTEELNQNNNQPITANNIPTKLSNNTPEWREHLKRGIMYVVKKKKYSLYGTVTLNPNVLRTYVDLFWGDVFSKLENVNNRHLSLMCKVNYYENMGFRSLAKMVKVNLYDKEKFYQYLVDALALKVDTYISENINEIVFTYVVSYGQIKDETKLIPLDTPFDVNTQSFKNKDIPLSMVPSDFGNVISETEKEGFTRYVVNLNNNVFQLDLSDDKNNLKGQFISDNKIQWSDTKTSFGFIRHINKMVYHISNGEIVLKSVEVKAKPFKKPVKEKALRKGFITLDIESVLIDGSHSPYLIAAYNGYKSISSYISAPVLSLIKAERELTETFSGDKGRVATAAEEIAVIKKSNSSLIKGLMDNFFDQLMVMVLEWNKAIVPIYAHNLGGFDGILLLKHLPRLGRVTPLVSNGKIISIEVKVRIPTDENEHREITLIFKDSLQMLNAPLRDLAKAFQIDAAKGFFPYLIQDVFYKGVLPAYEYWKGISKQEYEDLFMKYLNPTSLAGPKLWDYKTEAIKYCLLDCRVLHQILTKFNELIFKEFQVNIHGCLTLPSLAYKIYKVHFMPKNQIFQLVGEVEKAIRTGYTGGAVDVYKPHNKRGQYGDLKRELQRLYYYDVNSLYPYVMANRDMPVGMPKYFEGDILKYNPDAFGFFYCNIRSSIDVKTPILQTRIKTKGGIRTIAPQGFLAGYFFSDEVKNAIKKGYKVEILRGYLFEKGDLFSGYVNKLYALRQMFPKSDPMNMVAKLLMNSLYGKFGQSLERNSVEMIDITIEAGKARLAELLDKNSADIEDIIDDGDYYVIVKKSLAPLKYDEVEEVVHGIDVNIAIASCITAYARVHMSQFKDIRVNQLYYTDTDSVVVEKPLPGYMVGDKLGQMKLEYEIDHAVFLAPKTYALIDKNGKEVIKVKGIKQEIADSLTFKDLESLLLEDSSREFTQEKWIKSISQGTITVQDVAYTLKVTSNKRRAHYVNGEFHMTYPYDTSYFKQ